jgi:hypothetical protein
MRLSVFPIILTNASHPTPHSSPVARRRLTPSPQGEGLYISPSANNSLRNQGLGGSRCGSVSVRFKHHTVVFFIAAPPLRYPDFSR